MFYPPSLLDLTPAAKPVPIYDTPIVADNRVRSLAARIARGAWRRRTPEAGMEGPKTFCHEGGWK